jgi:ABC-type nitrate/sulfonate/bicarbonate transport system permease component
MQWKELWTIRGAVPFPWSAVIGVLPILLILALWAYATAGKPEKRMIHPMQLPSPGEVVVRAPELWRGPPTTCGGLPVPRERTARPRMHPKH